MEKKTMNWHGKTYYLIGRDGDGINYWLAPASWDCDWYWGFGYIQTFTNNKMPWLSKDISSHEHFDGLNRGQNINLYDAFKIRFIESPLYSSSPFSDSPELWTFCELMKSFYVAREYADMLYMGGAHYTRNPAKEAIKNEAEYKRINQEVIPAIINEVYELLTN